MSPPRNIALALLTALALAPAGLAAGMEQQYWTGHNTTELEPFYAEGAFKVTLGAWCFEGIGFVRAVLYDEAGTEVGRVQIIGEGVTDAVFETPPGQYRFDVIVSHWHIYTWEVFVEPLDAGEAAPQGPATAAPAGAAAGSAPSVGEQGDVVEIHMVSDGEDVYFDPIGVWVEPGTTIRFVLMSGVHDTQAYHPSNSTTLMRIPEGAEPWNSGIMGGILNRETTFEVTLTVEGVYDYFCLPHEVHGMVGRIIVGDPNAWPARPLDELPHPAAREALPSVEEIMANRVVRR